MNQGISFVVPAIAICFSSGLTACSSGDIPLGKAQAEAVTTPSAPPPASGTHRGASGASSQASGAAGATSADDGGVPASCTPNEALAGPYTLVSADGVPVTGDIEKVARITIDYAVRVESQIQIGNGCIDDCVLFGELSPGNMTIGHGDWGNVGTTDGEFNSDKTAFTWTTQGLLGNTDAAKYGIGFAGLAIRASITEPAPCEVDLVASFVREDLPTGVAPTEADLVTKRYVLARP